MNTRQMDCILELAQTLNFGKAAANLFMSQPTLTYQVNAAEEEVGFRIFDRSGRGTTLTAAGAQFAASLRGIRAELRKAVEQGQNFSAKYRENIRIALPIRSALHFLPDAIRQICSEDPGIVVSTTFDWNHAIDLFMQGEEDVLFAYSGDVAHLHDVELHPIFDSGIFLVLRRDDPLAGRKLAEPEDLKGRTLMVGGPSQSPLRRVQQRMIATGWIDYFNSDDHDTSLTNVAAGRAVVLSPGFLNDHTGEFAWIPFDCQERLPCVICTHGYEKRESVKRFVELLCSLHQPHQGYAP